MEYIFFTCVQDNITRNKTRKLSQPYRKTIKNIIYIRGKVTSILILIRLAFYQEYFAKSIEIKEAEIYK